MKEIIHNIDKEIEGLKCEDCSHRYVCITCLESVQPEKDDECQCYEKDRPHGEWIPITYRPMDEEEYEEFRKEIGELPIEERKVFSCQMPEDDQEILICTLWGGVSQDRCEINGYGYGLETQGDWDGVIAWMPLPEPPKE